MRRSGGLGLGLCGGATETATHHPDHAVGDA